MESAQPHSGDIRKRMDVVEAGKEEGEEKDNSIVDYNRFPGCVLSVREFADVTLQRQLVHPSAVANLLPHYFAIFPL